MTVIYAILLFCILIFIHELGHFTAAKACDIKVNEFAIGMGPSIFKRQKGETEYSLRAFPISRFCAMEEENKKSDDPRGFNNKSLYARMPDFDKCKMNKAAFFHAKLRSPDF